MPGLENKQRCRWAQSNKLLLAYHDDEWGVPVHDDRLLFEMLNLEGAQAGLSWLTILKKRGNYREAFDNFDARKIHAGAIVHNNDVRRRFRPQLADEIRQISRRPAGWNDDRESQTEIQLNHARGANCKRLARLGSHPAFRLL